MEVPVRFACVFPGQGSQSVGMMKGYADFPVVRDTFNEASDILGKDFWTMAEAGPADKLNLTVNTQPLMLMAGIAVYRAWESLSNTRPVFVAGHSLGEYTALVASGVLAFADALSLVCFRAEIMQQAVPEGVGGMAAILGLDDELVSAVCKQVTDASDGELLEPANFNSPGQIVIAGHRNAVLRGMELATSSGAKRALMLPMSVPSHCSLMGQAAGQMQQKLEQVRLVSPKIPVLHNADVQQHDEPPEIRKILVQQLCKPVRWTETIRSFAAAGVSHVMECGPGKVLAGLNKRIDGNIQSFALTDGVALRHAATVLG
ncbi:ACP S-malonyltransferase [Nitrosospira sp. NpAV]|uniref:ACP S-malonyltransferase n=1 Tax=Nitrosospira sp. NpAV TaxID=58133 RepID=UPI0005A14947|nr:ACP S-malonyltransferase [Nitrosospira sp. NpAV]KIO49802.1 ACP S-malonyltransferase [Nitrosospira sp. NpAV]